MIKTPLSTAIGGAFWTQGATVIGGNTPTFDQQIQKLFANGEQGFFYDPNDLSTMFQDAAGTIPVTAEGQPVGLMLDKSKNLRLGNNLVPQESFSSGTAGWLLGSQWSLVNGKVVCAGATSLNLLDIKLVVGKRYRITIDALRTSESGILSIRNGSSASSRVTDTEAKSKTIIEVTSLVNDASMYLYFLSQGWSGEISSIRIEEILGNHAYQTTSASRPILRKNAVTGANYLEFDGSDDFLQTGNIDFTATDKVSLFAGVRKLSDAATGVVCELSAIADTTTFGSFVLFAPAASGSNHYNFRSFGSTGNILGTSAVKNFPAPHSAVLRATGVISTNTCELLINGGSKQSTNTPQGTGNYGNYPLYIGRRGGTSLPLSGHIYGLIGVGKLTSDDETTTIEKEFAKRVGVTLNV